MRTNGAFLRTSFDSRRSSQGQIKDSSEDEQGQGQQNINNNMSQSLSSYASGYNDEDNLGTPKRGKKLSSSYHEEYTGSSATQNNNGPGPSERLSKEQLQHLYTYWTASSSSSW